MELIHCSSLSNCRLKFPPINSFHFGRSKTIFSVSQKSADNPVKKFNSLLIVSSTTDRGDAETAVVVEKPPPKLDRFQMFPGHPTPFGATLRDDGVNFAISSSNATSATLCLISISDLSKKRVTEQISLNPLTNKTGDVWHVFLTGDFENMVYGYKFDGEFSPEDGRYFDSSQILIDPHAKAIVSRGEYGILGPEEDCWPQMACAVPSDNDEFDWEGDLPLKFPQRDLIIYEMHVRGYTKNESSNAKFPGTYLGVVEKLDHLEQRT